MSFLTGFSDAETKAMYKEEGRQEGLKEGEAFGIIKALLKQKVSTETIISELTQELGIPENDAKAKIDEYLRERV